MTYARQEHPANRLRRSTRVPLWQQLLADLRARLADGEFTSTFPGELELVEQYKVSRHTVREALRHLRAEGIVTAARGRRPRLASVKIEQPLGALASLFAAVEARGLEQRTVVRSLDVRADGVVATHLGLEETTPLVYLERLRLAGEEPLALDRVWLPEPAGRPLLDADFTHTALYDELAVHCGIRLTGGREQVHAVLPTRRERDLLHLPSTAALLMVERTGCLHGRPLEFRHTLVRGDRYAITAAFDSRGYQVSASAARPSPVSRAPAAEDHAGQGGQDEESEAARLAHGVRIRSEARPLLWSSAAGVTAAPFGQAPESERRQ